MPWRSRKRKKLRKQQKGNNWAKFKEAEYNGCPHIKSFVGSRGGFSKEPLAIAYVLLNPVRSQIVLTPGEYIWSSVNEYFNERVSDIVDSSYVNQLFGTRDEFNRIMNVHRNTELVIHETKYGNLLGEVNFIEKALEKYNRRSNPDGSQSLQKMRKDDKYIDPVEKVLQEFEKMHNIKVDDIDVRGYEGKRLRGELLVHLKDRAGLKYSEIIEFPLFSSVQHGSLGRLYQNARRRMNW